MATVDSRSGVVFPNEAALDARSRMTITAGDLTLKTVQKGGSSVFRTWRNHWRNGLLLGTTALAILQIVEPVQAQGAPEAGSRGSVVSFAVPAGPLSGVLTQWAEAARLRLLVSSEAVRGLRSNGVNGALAPEQALARLLAGTGLTYRFTNASTVAIRRAGEGGAAAGNAPEGSIALDTIEVQGDGTVGYVATRSASGTKTQTPLVETPRAVSVVTRKELDDRGVQSVPEAVRYTAGVTTGAFGYDPRFDQIYIRGFAVTTLGDYRDGLRQIAGSYSTFLTEPYGLDRVDIIKGPASVLYGQGTPGGLIDRQSKLPTEQPIREVTAQLGTFGRLQNTFDIGGPVDPDKKFLYRVVGLGRTGETNYDIDDKRLMLAPSFTWRPTDQTSLTLYGLIQKDETDANVAMINRGGHVTKLRASDPNYDYQKQKQAQVGYKFEHRFNDVWAVRQNLRYGVFDVEGRYLTGSVTGGGFASTASTIYRRGAAAVNERVGTFQVDNQAQADFNTGPLHHTLLMGLDYSNYNSQFGSGASAANSAYALNILNPVYGLSGTTPAITSRTGTKMDQIGLYAQDQIKFGNWRLSLSSRQDWTDRTQTNLMTNTVTGQRNDEAFTYSAGLLYLFDNGIAPYASYATSFQPTNYLSRNGEVLAPSEGEQIEAGVKYQPTGGRLSLTLSAYQLIEKNAAKYAGVNSTTGLLYYESVGEIRTRGIEIEGRARLTDELDATASYTFADAEITRSNTAAEIGKVPSVTPRHVASLWLNYTVQSGALAGFGAGAGVRYVGGTWGNSTNTIRNDAYTLLDASLRYDLGKLSPRFSGVSVAVNANNITNKQAEICNAGLCYLGQGRTVLGTLKYTW